MLFRTIRQSNILRDRLIILICVLWFGSATANQDVTALNDILAQASSISAQFEQVTIGAGGKRLQASSGQLVVERPDRFRWQVATPFPQLVISDGNRVSIYDPDLEQLTIQALDPRAGATPALILSGDIAAISRDFNVKALQQEGDLMRFRLTPRAADSLFESLELSFIRSAINSMKLIDSLGSNTQIDFSSVQLNQSIDAELFIMNVPKGTDIIEDTL